MYFLPYLSSNFALWHGAVLLLVSEAASVLPAVLPAARAMHAVSAVQVLPRVPAMPAALDPGHRATHSANTATVQTSQVSTTRALSTAATSTSLLSTCATVLPTAALL